MHFAAQGESTDSLVLVVKFIMKSCVKCMLILLFPSLLTLGEIDLQKEPTQAYNIYNHIRQTNRLFIHIKYKVLRRIIASCHFLKIYQTLDICQMYYVNAKSHYTDDCSVKRQSFTPDNKDK